MRRRPAGLLLAGVLAALVAAAATAAGGHAPAPAVALSGDPTWRELSPAQRQALAPLAREWERLPADSKSKWVALANRFPSMSAEERQRVQARMADWARTSPRQRGEARLRFQEARTLSPAERQARWEAYRNLPPEQRQQLAETASKRRQQAGRATAADTSAGKAAVPARPQRDDADGLRKSNIVPPPQPAARKSIAPSVVQTRPGATTSLINRRPEPAPYIKPGQPKVAPGPAAASAAVQAATPARAASAPHKR
ncbi:MAG: DUF3106 domain-containing protein [Burkholderiales bacterium]|nr:DUF3106 domain-containing protein [Burkholderiales bacterium]